MQEVLKSKELETATLDNRELGELFERFNQASLRLEERYQNLLKETELLRAELQKKDQEVKRSQRLAALGQTAAAIAHEVRNPLGALELFIGLLKPKVAGQKPCEKILLKMGDCVKRLERVVQNILEFASERELLMSPVNIHNLLQDELLQCVGSNQGALRCETELEANPFILGHEQSLRQVFSNIFSNAKKFLPNGGIITVKTKDLADQSLLIQISDSGPGIKPALLDTLFDPFISGSESGTGLGLAIVKKLVEAHSGTIRAKNGEDQTKSSGAIFEIIFKRVI